jgi:hypothetical protein
MAGDVRNEAEAAAAAAAAAASGTAAVSAETAAAAVVTALANMNMLVELRSKNAEGVIAERDELRGDVARALVAYVQEIETDTSSSLDMSSIREVLKTIEAAERDQKLSATTAVDDVKNALARGTSAETDAQNNKSKLAALAALCAERGAASAREVQDAEEYATGLDSANAAILREEQTGRLAAARALAAYAGQLSEDVIAALAPVVDEATVLVSSIESSNSSLQGQLSDAKTKAIGLKQKAGDVRNEAEAAAAAAAAAASGTVRSGIAAAASGTAAVSAETAAAVVTALANMNALVELRSKNAESVIAERDELRGDVARALVAYVQEIETDKSDLDIKKGQLASARSKLTADLQGIISLLNEPQNQGVGTADAVAAVREIIDVSATAADVTFVYRAGDVDTVKRTLSEGLNEMSGAMSLAGTLHDASKDALGEYSRAFASVTSQMGAAYAACGVVRMTDTAVGTHNGDIVVAYLGAMGTNVQSVTVTVTTMYTNRVSNYVRHPDPPILSSYTVSPTSADRTSIVDIGQITNRDLSGAGFYWDRDKVMVMLSKSGPLVFSGGCYEARVSVRASFEGAGEASMKSHVAVREMQLALTHIPGSGAPTGQVLDYYSDQSGLRATWENRITTNGAAYVNIKYKVTTTDAHKRRKLRHPVDNFTGTADRDLSNLYLRVTGLFSEQTDPLAVVANQEYIFGIEGGHLAEIRQMNYWFFAHNHGIDVTWDENDVVTVTFTPKLYDYDGIRSIWMNFFSPWHRCTNKMVKYSLYLSDKAGDDMVGLDEVVATGSFSVTMNSNGRY